MNSHKSYTVYLVLSGGSELAGSPVRVTVTGSDGSFMGGPCLGCGEEGELAGVEGSLSFSDIASTSIVFDQA